MKSKPLKNLHWYGTLLLYKLLQCITPTQYGDHETAAMDIGTY